MLSRVPLRNRVALVSAADGKFAMPLAVALSSALRNMEQTREALVYVLDGGISPEDAVRCEAVITSSHPSVRLEWLRPDMQMFARFAESAWHSRAMYLRLLIPDLLPDDVERVLYVDSDVVVVRDLSPLWSVDFEQLAVYAVENFSHPTFATALPEAVSGIGASPETPYFNSGVLLMNLRVWREEGISEQVNAFLRDRPDLIKWGDQDALNLAIAGRWGALDPIWNVQLGTLRHFGQHGRKSSRQQSELLKNAAIIHFQGPRKPWDWKYNGLSDDKFFGALLRSEWLKRRQGKVWVSSRALAHRVWWLGSMAKRLSSRATRVESH